MTSSYSPVLTTKAVKDETEQRILRDAHVCHQHTDKHTAMYMHTHVHKLLKKNINVVIYEAELCNMSLDYISLTSLCFLTEWWDIYK